MAGILALPVFLLEMGSHLIPGMEQLIERTIGTQWNWLTTEELDPNPAPRLSVRREDTDVLVVRIGGQ